MNYGSSDRMSVSGSRSVTFKAEGRGKLTKIQFYGNVGNSGAMGYAVTISGGGLTTSGSGVVSGMDVTVYTAALSPTITIQPGVTYTVTFSTTSSTPSIYVGGKTGGLGFLISSTPQGQTSGTMTAVSRDPGVSWKGARAWVRCSGGAVGLTLNGRTMTAAGSRAAKTWDGLSCTERAFTLADGSAAQNASLALSVSNSVNCRIYDYGVVLL